MAKKVRPVHVCTDCGYQAPKWLGRCPECGAWGTLNEQLPSQPSTQAVSGQSTTPQPITSIPVDATTATTTGIAELDRVLGNGLVPGSVVLLSGEPGVGKSTLLLDVAAHAARANNGQNKVLYATAEESTGQVRLRAERTGALDENLLLVAESNLDTIFHHVDKLKPTLIVVDSVQTMHAPGVEGVPGGVAQSRAVTAALTTLAKTTGVSVILVGHVTKDGNVAGPRVLEHLVDVVLHFEGDKHSSLRMLRGLKNRFGATDEVGCFEQTANGIQEVSDPSGLFLSSRDASPDGTAITVAMDGVRPILAEIQALLMETPAKNPRRAVTGLDSTRAPMVLAVLAARAGLQTADKEVYIATVGGMKIGEPAADLAVAMATASALTRTPLPQRTIVIGEIGLAGELRRVPSCDKRLAEAARLGFERAIVPRGSVQAKDTPLVVSEVSTVAQALEFLKK